MVTTYESFVNSPDFTQLSEEGLQAKFGINEFSSLFESALFESESDNMLLEKAYGTYELGLLYENRKSWFEDEEKIYMLEGDGHKILFKENSMFIITNGTYNLLNEGWFDDTLNWVKRKVSSAVTAVKTAAKTAVNAVASTTKSTWDALSDGAKKVYAFGKRIVSAAVAFAKANPLEAVSITLNILSILLSFFPPIGVWVNPVLMCLAGALEVYSGSHHIMEGFHKIKAIEPAELKGGAGHFAAGVPLIIAGSISMLFGVHDIITSPTAGTGAGPISSAGGKRVAAKWGETFAGKTIHGFEHFMEKGVAKVTAKMGDGLVGSFGKFVGEKVSANAPAIINLLLITTGKHVLGSMWNGLIYSLSGIAKAFSFLLDIPTKLGNVIKNFKKNAETTGGKIISSALDSFIGPASRGIGAFLDKHIKPTVNGISGWLSNLALNHKEIEKISEEVMEADTVEVKPKEVKPKNAVVQKEDDSKIKKLPAVTEPVKESSNYIRRFGEFSTV